VRMVAVVAAVLVVSACGSAAGAPRSAADGVIETSIPVSDTENVALRKLDPELLSAVQDAATDARADGIELRVTSGWRSREYQQQLLDEAVDKYGSAEVARQYVATPDTSAHVTGDAVDIGPTDAADWVVRHGDDYGLCQVYSNEMWHFELLTSPGGDCPPLRSNAAG
jgi:zinc D-Ala-D-Ala carboxypeptidase